MTPGDIACLAILVIVALVFAPIVVAGAQSDEERKRQ